VALQRRQRMNPAQRREYVARLLASYTDEIGKLWERMRVASQAVHRYSVRQGRLLEETRP
jgi:hypothetical protein